MENITQQALLASFNSHSHSEIFYFCLHFKYKSAEGQRVEKQGIPGPVGEKYQATLELSVQRDKGLAHSVLPLT